MAMYWDLGALVMPLRILKETLLLYYHILCLPVSSVAYRVLKIQENKNFPSLRDEVVDFLNKHEVNNVQEFSKQSWRKYVREKILSMNREYILTGSKNYKKIDHVSMACEDFGMKDYFNNLNLADSRLKFRERSHCMTSCRTDYPSDLENIREMFSCYHCDEIDTVDYHWKSCEGYKHLRANRNLNIDSDLCGYYRDIIKLRIDELK